MTGPARLAVLAVGLLAGFPGRALALSIVVKNLDLPGQGFNDSTPAAPVGGNTATTVGQQRLAVFARAAQLWGAGLVGTVPLEVDANFAALPCTGGQTVLGHAGPTTYVSNAGGLPADTWYPVGLANQLIGTDAFPGESDIEATFNGGLSACTNGREDWYYGFDGKAGDQIDLLHVVLHELGHGLGFLTLVDATTGVAPQGRSDPYSKHVVDSTTGQAWPAMTEIQRVASARGARKLAWDGTNVARQMAQILPLGAPVLRTTPALPGLAGHVAEAEFGRYLSQGAVSGPLQVGTLSTSTCGFVGTAPGAVVLIRQNVCAPIQQAYNAQLAGALAVLMTDQDDRDPPLTVDTQPSSRSQYPVTIPVLGVSPDEAQILATAAVGTTVQLSPDAAVRVGGDKAGRTLLFASDPILPTSSVSHWEVLARPNLLMEPFESPDPVFDMRMELALFRDLGWSTTCGNGTVDAGEACDQGAQNGAAGASCQADCTVKVGGTGGTGGATMDVPDSGAGGSGPMDAALVPPDSSTGTGGRGGATGGTGGVVGGTGGAIGGTGGATGGSGGAATGGATGTGGTGGALGTGGAGGSGGTGGAMGGTGGAGGVIGGMVSGDAGAADVPAPVMLTGDTLVGGCSCDSGRPQAGGHSGYLVVGLVLVLIHRRTRTRLRSKITSRACR